MPHATLSSNEEVGMRGDDEIPEPMFSYVLPEQRVPQDHPLRPIRAMVDAVLKELSPRFARLYAKTGRPSIPPEKLLRALLLQVLYSVRSERQLIEQLDYNLLFRWFVGLPMDAPVWDPTVFTKNRERLLQGDIAQAFFTRVLDQARTRALLSAEHFTVDGTLVAAWARHKSFKPKTAPPEPPPDDPGNPTVDFRGERRPNATHASTTDPEARLAKKSPGHAAQLAYHGHVLMDNRHGLAGQTRVTPATGTAEREAAMAMLRALPRHRSHTLAGDQGDDVRDVVRDLRRRGLPAPAPQDAIHRARAIDPRPARHPGYVLRQPQRGRAQEIVGWLKTVAPRRKPRHRGGRRVGWIFTSPAAGYNPVRIRNLAAAP